MPQKQKQRCSTTALEAEVGKAVDETQEDFYARKRAQYASKKTGKTLEQVQDEYIGASMEAKKKRREELKAYAIEHMGYDDPRTAALVSEEDVAAHKAGVHAAQLAEARGDKRTEELENKTLLLSKIGEMGARVKGREKKVSDIHVSEYNRDAANKKYKAALGVFEGGMVTSGLEASSPAMFQGGAMSPEGITLGGGVRIGQLFLGGELVGKDLGESIPSSFDLMERQMRLS